MSEKSDPTAYTTTPNTGLHWEAAKRRPGVEFLVDHEGRIYGTISTQQGVSSAYGYGNPAPWLGDFIDVGPAAEAAEAMAEVELRRAGKLPSSERGVEVE